MSERQAQQQQLADTSCTQATSTSPHTHTRAHTHTCSWPLLPSSSPLPLILLRSSVTTPYCRSNAASYSGGSGKGKGGSGPCAALWLLGCQCVVAWCAAPPASPPSVPLRDAVCDVAAQRAVLHHVISARPAVCACARRTTSGNSHALRALQVPHSSPPEGHHKGEELLWGQQQHGLGRGRAATPLTAAAAAAVRVRAAGACSARPPLQCCCGRVRRRRSGTAAAAGAAAVCAGSAPARAHAAAAGCAAAAAAAAAACWCQDERRVPQAGLARWDACCRQVLEQRLVARVVGRQPDKPAVPEHGWRRQRAQVQAAGVAGHDLHLPRRRRQLQPLAALDAQQPRHGANHDGAVAAVDDARQPVCIRVCVCVVVVVGWRACVTSLTAAGARARALRRTHSQLPMHGVPSPHPPPHHAHLTGASR
jgi:hypothetical protein